MPPTPGGPPRPLTSIGRCQALGRVGRCRSYVVWALLLCGSPYHVGPASAHSAQGLASADRSEGSGWGASPGGGFSCGACVCPFCHARGASICRRLRLLGWGAAEGEFLFEHFSHVPAHRETFPEAFLIFHIRSTRRTHLSTSWKFWRQPFGTKPLFLFAIWARSVQKHIVLCWGQN